MLLNLARAAADFVAIAFGGASQKVAHRALTTLAHRLQLVPRSGLTGSLAVKVTYHNGQLKNVFVLSDDEAVEVTAM